MSFPGLLREGGERGFIEDVAKWMEYRKKRNITAHTYDPEKAESVYTAAVAFAGDARKLLSALEKSQGA
jgi:nucleotidyltransferase substrate binding protein (TIGR01987 family)